MAQNPTSHDTSSATGCVFNIMRYSTQDGPGLRTTVFLKGCPLSCAWCHNPESQSGKPVAVWRDKRCIGCGGCAEVCPAGAITKGEDRFLLDRAKCTVCGTCAQECPTEAREIIGREMSVAQVMAEVIRDLAFYEESGGGVTFSGGEPLAQPEFLTSLLEACKSEEIKTCVDTCGAGSWSVFERIIPLTDLFLFDLKIMDPDRHRKSVGADLGPILKNLRKLAESGAEIVIRVPIIPGLTDDRQNIESIGEFVASLRTIRYIKILPYHQTGMEKYRLLSLESPLKKLDPPSPGKMAELVEILGSFGLEILGE